MKLVSRRSLRTRLTLWYVGVLAGILVCYVGAVFAFQYALLKRQMFHDEVQDMVTVEGLLFFNTTGSLELQQNYFSRPRSRILVDRLMEVRDLSGVVLYRSPTLHRRTLGAEPTLGEGSDSFDPRTVRLSDGDDVYLISHTHPIAGHQVLIRLAYSLQPLGSRMLRFLTLLLCTLPLALIAAAFAGYGIAKRALQPLDLMAARAQLITATNLSDRLPVPPEDDELGHMASVLNALFARLERAFAEMKRFTADAAHELRTPLANQRLSGEIAMRERPEEVGYREVISEMLEETMRLGQTIDSLLVLARVEAQQTGSDLVGFQLSELIVEVCQLFDVLLEDRHLLIVQRSFAEKSTFITGYRDFLRLALINVVHNAIKFSPAGGQIGISISPVNIGSLEGRRVCVQDAGPGIPEDERETVFERFYTGRKPETKQNTGVGLGLSIARLAVERCGGRISFCPSEHSGTLCCIELPVGTRLSP